MPQLLLRDMMTTNVRTVREDDSLSTADWDMAFNEVRHLPVVDGENRVVGIVSDRDVIIASARRPHESIAIAQVMTREVQTVLPSLPAIDAAAQLLRSKYGALPVVDERGVMLGIVTTTDFVELAHRALAGLDVQRPHVRA
jgi:CBS-domain-containing membrane protein